jgi:hypothetical protein
LSSAVNLFFKALAVQKKGLEFWRVLFAQRVPVLPE